MVGGGNNCEECQEKLKLLKKTEEMQALLKENNSEQNESRVMNVANKISEIQKLSKLFGMGSNELSLFSYDLDNDSAPYNDNPPSSSGIAEQTTAAQAAVAQAAAANTSATTAAVTHFAKMATDMNERFVQMFQQHNTTNSSNDFQQALAALQNHKQTITKELDAYSHSIKEKVKEASGQAVFEINSDIKKAADQKIKEIQNANTDIMGKIMDKINDSGISTEKIKGLQSQIDAIKNEENLNTNTNAVRNDLPVQK